MAKIHAVRLLKNLEAKVLIGLLLVMSASTGFAVSSTPVGISYQGRLYQNDGVTPITSTVDLLFEITNPAGTCVLYAETQNIDLSTTAGFFSTEVGSGTGSSKRTGTSDPGLTMAQVFKNGSTITGASSCSYSAAAGDGRMLRITISKVAGSTVNQVLSPLQAINSVPYAQIADTLQGKTPTDFVSISGNVTQTIVDQLSAQSTNLLNLAAGTSSSYVKSTDLPISSGIVNLSSAGQGVLVPNTPASASSAVNKTYADTHLGGRDIDSVAPTTTGQTLRWNQSTSKWEVYTPSSGGTVTSVTAGTGLSGGTISTTGTISMPNVGTAGTYTKVTTDAQGRVSSGASLNATDITTALGFNPLDKAGGTMTGALVLAADPAVALGAATKQYVDSAVSAGGGNAIKKDGTVAFTAAQSMGGFKLTSVADPTAAQDAATKNYADTTIGANKATLGVLNNTTDIGKVMTWTGTTNGFQMQTPSGGGGGTITNVTASAPLSASGTTSINMSIATADGSTTGALSSADWTTFNSKLGTALTAGNIFVGNASNVATGVAVSGDATMSNAGALTLVNTGTAGTYTKVTTDAKGRVTSGTNLGSSDVTTALGFTPANIAGDTFTGAVVLAGDPAAALGAATKQYVDSAVSTAGGNYIKKDGTVAFTAAQSMGGFKLTTVADPTAAQDAATKNYVDTALSTGTSSFVKKDGSVAYTAAQSMGGFKLTSVADPTAAQDAATKNYVDLNVGGNKATVGVLNNSTDIGKALIWSGTTNGWQATAVGGGTVTNVTASAPLSASGTTSINMSIATADGSTTGALSSADWTTFNSKLGTALTAGNIFVGNASNVATGVAVSGDATMSNAGALTLVNTGTAGTYTKVTTDAKGRVTSGTNLGSSDVTTALGFTPANKAGDTFTGAVVLAGDPAAALGAATKQYVDSAVSTAGGNYIKKDGTVAFTADQPMGGFKITGLGTPSAGTDAATKTYVDTMLPKAGGTMTGTLTLPTDGLVVGSNQVSINSGNVAIGQAASSSTAKLQVAGAIVSNQNIVASGASVNFATGNVQVLQAPGTATLTTSNMIDGGAYTVIVEDTTARQYTFSSCTNSYWQPANATTSGRTVYTLLKVTVGGNVNCYISWITGF